MNVWSSFVSIQIKNKALWQWLGWLPFRVTWCPVGVFTEMVDLLQRRILQVPVSGSKPAAGFMLEVGERLRTALFSVGLSPNLLDFYEAPHYCPPWHLVSPCPEPPWFSFSRKTFRHLPQEYRWATHLSSRCGVGTYISKRSLDLTTLSFPAPPTPTFAFLTICVAWLVKLFQSFLVAIR